VLPRGVVPLFPSNGVPAVKTSPLKFRVLQGPANDFVAASMRRIDH
jgi:hypothetical protein